jgi:hypothetical protein
MRVLRQSQSVGVWCEGEGEGVEDEDEEEGGVNRKRSCGGPGTMKSRYVSSMIRATLFLRAKVAKEAMRDGEYTAPVYEKNQISIESVSNKERTGLFGDTSTIARVRSVMRLAACSGEG